MSELSSPGEIGPDVAGADAAQSSPGGSEESYRNLFQTHPHPMWVYDIETLRFLAVNDAAVCEYGYSREEFLGMTLRQIHPAEDLDDVLTCLAGLGPAERYRRCTHVSKTGRIIDVEIASSRLEFEGRPARLVLASEISERTLAEEQVMRLNRSLKTQLAELETLLNIVPAGIAITEEPQARNIRVNRALAKSLRLEPGANASSGAPPEERPPYKILREGRELAPEEMPMQLSASKGIECSEVEIEAVFPDGGKATFLTSAAPLFDENGNPHGCVASFLDITGRKAAENALREANETMQAVIEASPLAIVAMDFDGNVKSWNRAAEQIFGWKPEEVLGRPFPIVPEEDMEFFRTNVFRARTGGTVAGIERKRRRKDGALIDVGLWNAVQRDGSGTPVGVISVIADITERKRLEEELRRSQKMEAVGRLAGGVAHDFNNLMTVVTGFGRLVLDSLPSSDPLHWQVEEILKAGNRAAALTNQLLAFGRRQIIHPRVLDLNQAISDAERMLRRVIAENIELVLALDPNAGRVRADAGQIEQILMNLVVNARDAMPKGGTIRLETYNAALKEQPHVVLAVSDTGSGMDEETLSRVFEPFFTTKGLGRGTGLGLSTVYGIVKQNGGDVTVSSEPGCGTTFRIFLPQAEPFTAMAGLTGEAIPLEQGSETILLVEDEPAVRYLTREMLRKQGYTVIEASNGREALEVYDAHQGTIDVLVTDVVMPHMSGQDLSTRLQSVQPDLKVLYLSGYAEHIVAEHGVPARGAALLQKPFTLEALARKLREVLDAP